MRRNLIAVAVLLALVWFATGMLLERFINRVEPVPLPAPTAEAGRLHAAATIVDLHADSLLFGRDLLTRSGVGHVDVPRLLAGNVAVQLFTAATKVPRGLNIERNDGDAIDSLTLAGCAQLAPPCWRGPLGRAQWQADRLLEMSVRSDGRLVRAVTRADLDAALARRADGESLVVGILGIEGAHALEGDLANFATIYDAGYRMLGFAHFFDNAFAGSAHGVEKHGLTPLGRELLARMEAQGVLVDLAHSSAATIDDVLAAATKPTVVSHGGVRGTCDNQRNLSDEQIRRIAAGGGVIGIGYWETAVCGTAPRHIVAAIRHVIELVGDDHVALGSDYDGGTTVAFDTSQLIVLTQAMLDAGLNESTIRKVLGENALRVLRATLP